VIRISEKLGAKARISAAVIAAFAAVGLTACAAPGGTPAATVTNTVTQTAPAGQASAAGNSTAAAPNSGTNGSNGTSSAADASATGRLPDYQPSKVVSQSEYSTVLTSSDRVSKVGAFYQNALDAGGWHVASSSMGAFHASFTAYRGHDGASISVYFRLGGSGISISTYNR
jgi:hypothetical protein